MPFLPRGLSRLSPVKIDQAEGWSSVPAPTAQRWDLMSLMTNMISAYFTLETWKGSRPECLSPGRRGGEQPCICSVWPPSLLLHPVTRSFLHFWIAEVRLVKAKHLAWVAAEPAHGRLSPDSGHPLDHTHLSPRGRGGAFCLMGTQANPEVTNASSQERQVRGMEKRAARGPTVTSGKLGSWVSSLGITGITSWSLNATLGAYFMGRTSALNSVGTSDGKAG